ncbi:MAG TPA: alginate export family protein [Opitutaceae bacterium]|nr:alginate export family protein [Opitutaceae bacterium]
MKKSRLSLLSPVFACAVSSALAQPAPAKPASAPYPGLINTKLRAGDASLSNWDFGINVRLREEDKEESGTTDAGSNWDFSKRPQDDNQNEYQLVRVMPHIGYTDKWFTAFAEGRTSYAYGDERYNSTAPGKGLSETDGPIDIYQAYLMIGNHKEFPFSIKIGRQELTYGEQRLVGHSRWTNLARTFDAVKVRYQNAWMGVDVFTSGVVYVDDRNLNSANLQDQFSGAYFNFPTISKNEIVEAYLYNRTVSRGIVTDDWSGVAAPARFPAPQDLYTAGLRIKSKPNAYNPWDYGVEVMYQFGDRTAVAPGTAVAAAKVAPRLTQRAYAAIAQLGYTFSDAWAKPRVAFIYSGASGDKDAADGKSQTFQNLFPSNHGLYGIMDLSGLQNLQDFRLTYSIKPLPTLTLTLEGHMQFLSRRSDFWYNAAGVPRNFTGAASGSGAGYRINPSYSNKLGQELDFVGTWSVTPYTQLELGLGHYFRGDYVKESLATVGSHDANYAYFQVTLNL